MINKQGLWFLTLFSLILVLSVYYITMPNELLLTNNSSYNKDTEKTNKEDDDKETDVKGNATLTTMRVNLDEERLTTITNLQSKLTSSSTTTEEKNNIFEQLRSISKIKSDEEKLEKKLTDSKKLESFIKIDNNKIEVVVAAKEHSNALAVEIMKLVQEEFTNKMYISVKFAT